MESKVRRQDGISTYRKQGDGLFIGDELLCTVNELYDDYCNNNLLQKEIAEKYDISEFGLRKLLKFAGISRRSKSEVVSKQWKVKQSGIDPDGIYHKGKMLCTKQELYDLYWKDEMRVEDLGEKFGISRHMISHILKRYNIPIRTAGEIRKLTHKKIKKLLNPNYLYKLNKYPICSKEDFQRLYYDEKETLENLAHKFNTTTITLKRQAKSAGFVLRTAREQMILTFENRDYTGEKHPCWKGGIRECEGYVYIWHPTHHLADRHGYVREHALVMEKKLGRSVEKGEVIHHINFIKNDNSMKNLYVYPNNGSHRTVHMNLSGIMHDLFDEKIILFEDGKYIVNKNLISKLSDENKEA